MKIAELKLTTEWQNILDLVPDISGLKVELYNAAINTSEICYTNNDTQPVATTFYKVLKAQTGVILTVREQPLWVKSEYGAAKLMVSKVED